MAYLDPRIREVFRSVALGFFNRINSSDFRYEDDTNNLRASSGIGIFKEGVLTDWIENPYVPTRLKEVTYKRGTRTIDGNELLDSVLGQIDTRNFATYVMVVVAAAPYAYSVDQALGSQPADGHIKRGKGWWSEDVVPKLITDFMLNLTRLQY